MRIFFRHHDRFQVYQVKSILDDEGIPCFIKNELLQGTIGEIPPMDAEPEIWLHDDKWQPKAQKILEHFYQEQANVSPDNTNDWVCAACGQMNEFQFAICWQCQEPRMNDTA
jgi:hypothetical protein